jgi:hypothetical protein
MDKKSATISIVAPIRNREKYLPYYLENIFNLNYDKKNIVLFFLINNSFDSSKKILKDFKAKNNKNYKNIIIEDINKNINGYNEAVKKIYGRTIPKNVNADRDVAVRNIFLYSHLAEMRNYILNKCNTDYIFSVDSDIMVYPETLNELLLNNKKCISALICNGHHYKKIKEKNNVKIDEYKYSNCLYYTKENKPRHIFKSSYNKGLIEIDITGAVYLIHKDIYKKCKYGYDLNGEDAYFCRQVQNLGYKIYCDTNIKLPHCMSEELLQEYIDGNFKF